MSLCECGCGQKTVVSHCTDRSHGWTKGEPRRFIQGHNNRMRRASWITKDRGYETLCFIYQGGLNHAGYGRGSRGQAHRVLWEEVHGPVPVGLELDHLCRQRDCVRVDHLEAVTHEENMRRSVVARASAKASVIAQARARLSLSQEALAERVGVSQALVSMWESGKAPLSLEHAEALRRELAEGFAVPVGGSR